MDGLASDAFAFHICVLHFFIYKRFAAADYNSLLGRDLRPFSFHYACGILKVVLFLIGSHLKYS
jgi:hypothetical protein